MQKRFSTKTNVKQLILIASQLFADLTSQQAPRFCSIFNSNTTPQISISKLLKKLRKYTHFSAQCLLLAIIYIDRYSVAMQNFEINKHNLHKLILAALLLATKFQDDFSIEIIYFQFVTGINRLHLHQLELQLLKGLDYNLNVSIEDFKKFDVQLQEVYARQLKQ